MALLIQQIHERTPKDTNKVAMPPAWLTMAQLEKAEKMKDDEHVKELAKSVSHYLPIAAQRAQELISALDNNLNIVIPVSYLTIENSTTFHVALLVSQTNYLSPEMQAAKILTENFKLKDNECDMHYTFTVDVEFLSKNSYVTSNYKLNSYKLKHIPDSEKNLRVGYRKVG